VLLEWSFSNFEKYIGAGTMDQFSQHYTKKTLVLPGHRMDLRGGGNPVQEGGVEAGQGPQDLCRVAGSPQAQIRRSDIEMKILKIKHEQLVPRSVLSY
jgi:hypothetical protein